MKILDVVQGTDQWLAIRAKYDCASDAPVMMGASKNATRNDLIKLRATGSEREISEWVQRVLFSRGHEAEAKIRPYIESIIGDDLYPTTAVNGDKLASFDGMTMDERTLFEHKLWNEELAAAIKAGELDPMYYWQLEHQLAVDEKAERVIFVCSDGTPEKCVHMIYTPVPGRAAQLNAGWAQLKADVLAWVPPAAEVITEAKVIKALPALAVQLVGEVKTSNLALYRSTALDFIRNINTDLQTDQDFADAQTTVTFCEKAEKELQAVKQSALAQTASIDELFRTVDQLSEEMRQKRLTLEKLVTKRKDEIRGEIVQNGRKLWMAHIEALDKRLARVRGKYDAPDFVAAVKGKRTLSSLRGAVDDALAKAKIAANQQADDIATNLGVIDEITKDHTFLVHDLADLVTINPAHLAGVLNGRVAAHERAEAEKVEKIRKEEQAKAEAKAAAEAAAEAEKARAKIREEEQAKAKEEAARTPAPVVVEAPTPAPAPVKESAGFGPVANVKPLGRAPISHFAMRSASTVLLRFEGSSDDTFGEVSHFRDDYDNCASGKHIDWVVTAPGVTGGLVVSGQYGRNATKKLSVSWQIGVAPYDPTHDDVPAPEWPMRFERGSRPYSLALVIEAPAGVAIQCLQIQKQTENS